MLDEIIKLKMKKMDLLKSARKVAFGSSDVDFVEVSAVDSDHKALKVSGKDVSPSTERRRSTAILPKTTSNGDDLFFQTIEIKNNYTMNALSILTVKSSKVNSRNTKIGSSPSLSLSLYLYLYLYLSFSFSLSLSPITLFISSTYLYVYLSI